MTSIIWVLRFVASTWEKALLGGIKDLPRAAAVKTIHSG